MAYQPKSYRKFVATAATATLVATAFAPFASAHSFKDVETKYNDAVDFLVSKGVTGYTDGSFKTQKTITRLEAAEMLGKALGLTEVKDAPASGFTDVPARVATLINAFKAKGITNGKTETTFGANDEITRGELAIWIQKAYDLKAKDGSTNKFGDVADRYKAAVQALVDNGITQGTTETTFGTTANAKRGDYALFIKRAVDAVAELKVAAVSVVNSNTLTVSGTGLKNLKLENLTLAGNTATEITPSADGKTATVKFSSAFTPDQEYSLVVKVAEVEQTFKFKFSYDVTKATVVAGTFDDDTKGQRVSLKINDADADFNALRVAGYTVKFVAVNSSNTEVSGTFFKDTATGVLADTLTSGDYTVQVTVSKGSSVVVSEKQTIKVRNLEAAATAVKGYVLTNNTLSVGEQKSSTLVVGEQATVNKIIVTTNGVDFDVTDSTKYKVTSSNPAVVSVDSAGTLTANTPGTATITVVYGDVKRDFTLTVANAARYVAKFTPASSTVAIVGANKSATVSVSAVDQYGDLVANAPITVEVPSVVTSSSTATTQLNGKADVTVTSVAAGSGSVILKSNGRTLGSFGVRITQYDNVASQRLEIVKKSDTTYSADASLDLNADDKVEYALNLYNSENLPNGSQDLTGYKVSYNADVVTIGTAATGLQDKAYITGPNLTISAKSVGSTTVAVYNTANLLVGQFTITVTNSGYSISSVNFKAVPTVDYKGKTINVTDVLDVVDSANDDIVKGITLSKPTAHAVRIDSSGVLYIDANGNGLNDTLSEVQLATVTAEVVTGGKGALSTAGSIGIFTGVTTASSDDAGTVVFKVLTGSTIKAHTSVNVDVK